MDFSVCTYISAQIKLDFPAQSAVALFLRFAEDFLRIGLQFMNGIGFGRVEG